MKSALQIKTGLRSRIIGRPLALFMDFDGTLAPIASRFDLARLPAKTRSLLQRLAARPDCRIGIVSGRSVRDLKEKVGLKGLTYIGNHGLELDGLAGSKPGVMVTDRQLKSLKRLDEVLKKELGSVPAVLLQYKKLTLSVHYRLAAPRDWPSIKKAVFQSWSDLPGRRGLKIGGGKKVWEIRPAVAWDKGKAVNWLLKQKAFKNALPIYLGDDLTDEDAFRALKKKGLTVLIGRPRPSAAAYYLKDTRSASDFLGKILQAKRTGRWPS